MKQRNRRIGWILAAAMLLSALCGCGRQPQAGDKDLVAKLPDSVILLAEAPAQTGSPVALTRQDSEPLTLFSRGLLKEAWEEAREAGARNPVLSPVSVYLAMMVTACSNDRLSDEQMAEWEALFGVPQGQWKDWGARWMRHLNWAKGESCVTAANSLWLDTGMTLGQDVLQSISQHLYTDVYQGDLQGQEIVEAVNAWVDHKTQGMIHELRQAPYDPAAMRSILNTVYLEAKWQEAFLFSRIEEKVFYTAEQEEVLTEFLTDPLCCRDYVQGEGWDGVVLPYRDGNLAFLALRPTAGQSADEVLLSLAAADWKDMCDRASDVLMNLSMPKFTVEYQQDLTDVLEAMGLKAASTDGGFGIGQTVKFQVDKDGTKAAAVTEVTQAGVADTRTEVPMEVHFDRPYVYAVVDAVTGVPLFVGVMDCPVQE